MNTRTQASLVKRRKEFRRALISEGITARAFAGRVGITEQHLARAFRQPHLVHRRIHAVIGQLIAKHRQAA